jgi:hypothetical protein
MPPPCWVWPWYSDRHRQWDFSSPCKEAIMQVSSSRSRLKNGSKEFEWRGLHQAKTKPDCLCFQDTQSHILKRTSIISTKSEGRTNHCGGSDPPLPNHFINGKEHLDSQTASRTAFDPNQVHVAQSASSTKRTKFPPSRTFR